MAKSRYANRFSLAHPDKADKNPDRIYKELLNATEEYVSEITDIYFGKDYRYEHNGEKKRYGSVMGVEASDDHIKYLFKIQDEIGIPISLTINQMTHPDEIMNDSDVLYGFLDHIQWFYDKGLRICTIAHTHLMASRILHNRFPEMHWKNTVNHLVRTAQEVVDYAHLGYDTVLLDRSLNRDLNELKKVKKAADKVGVKTSLLVAEACMSACPFKVAHDAMQPEYERSEKGYWATFGQFSCNRWRTPTLSKLPRVGVDCVWATRETFDEYAKYVDIFKYSGRLHGNENLDDSERQAVWSMLLDKDADKFNNSEEVNRSTQEEFTYATSFQELYDQDLVPFHKWSPQSFKKLVADPTAEHNVDFESGNIHLYKIAYEKSIWSTKRGKALDKVLKTCRSQCWDCHACERCFKEPDFDSLLEFQKPDLTLPPQAEIVDLLEKMNEQ